MVIYHLSTQVISRKGERGAVAAAAYRARTKLRDFRLKETFDYTRSRRALHTEILSPANVPPWVHDREYLWNQVEAAEKRKDSQVAREINIALPAELSQEKQIELVQKYVQEQFVALGMIADISVHKPPKDGDQRNIYAHILLTTRDIDSEGFGMKNRNWNRKELLLKWREQWAVYVNRALAEAGISERVDHRTLEAQGINREPTVHLGFKATDLERSGITTKRGEHNRRVKQGASVAVEQI